MTNQNPITPTRGASRQTLARGRARMKEIAVENEIERKVVETDLLDSLGRPPSALDRIAAEEISAAVIRGRRLRALGRDDSEQRKSIAQLMRASNFKPEKPQAAPKPDFRAEMLAAATPKVANT